MSTSRLGPWIRRLAHSEFNYWCGFVAYVVLIGWYFSRAFHQGAWVLPWSTSILIVSGAWLFWTFTEYFFHRWMYHAWESVFTVGHGLHHDNPIGFVTLPWFLPMPALIGLYYLLAFLWEPAKAGLFLSVWWAGYVSYGSVHHALHHFHFRNAWFKSLVRHHKIHHKLDDRNFGVTTFFWDRVLGTLHRKARPPRVKPATSLSGTIQTPPQSQKETQLELTNRA